MTRSRVPVIIVMVVALVLSIVSRNWAQSYRTRSSTPGATSSASLGRFNSYALALLLGGLRGPLVMTLWTSSEAQKGERNLEDFDTKVEWIRLLQPEFDSVHIFQMWNKAYNVSVQMASIANKYATILDAIDYGMSVDSERPNDINILMGIGSIWFDKLGGSNEKTYYIPRVREESLPHRSKLKLAKNQPGWRRVELDPVLDEKGNILPEYLKPHDPSAKGVETSDLEYLKRWEPFPQGLSPRGFGYNYFKRSQMLQSAGKQKHLQLSELVIDSRPALALKVWAEEEWERGRTYELLATGLKAPSAERLDLEMPTASVKPDTKPADPAAIDNAIYCYQRAADYSRGSLEEYARHLAVFAQNFATYRAHQDVLEGIIASCQADGDYLKALKATPGDEKAKLLVSAKEGYMKARDIWALSVIQYYVDDDLLATLLPAGVNKFNIKQHVEQFKSGDLTRLALQLDRLSRDPSRQDQHNEDRDEYLTYMHRIQTRLDLIAR